MASPTAAVGPAVDAMYQGVAANAAISNASQTTSTLNTIKSVETSATANNNKMSGDSANNAIGAGASLTEKATKPA